MATADQILSLIRNHLNNDDAQFRKVALQIAALEARSGHVVVSRTIHELLNREPKPIGSIRMVSPNSIATDLLLQVNTCDDKNDLVLSSKLKEKLDRIVKEYLKKDVLRKHGLTYRRKLLFYGAPGTGKTMTANVLAHEFNLPFFFIRTEKIVTKFMGETGQKLGRVFDFISDVQGVYLFDEFDAIGSQRGMDNEVGEQRRILNTFLQLLERDDSDSFIIAATNNIESIDKAMFRRFDDVIEYTLPDREQRISLLQEYLHVAMNLDFVALEPLFEGMSHAEIKMICSDILKESLLNDVNIDIALVRNVVGMRHKLNYQIS